MTSAATHARLPADVELSLREAIECALRVAWEVPRARHGPLGMPAGTTATPSVERLEETLYASWYTAWSPPTGQDITLEQAGGRTLVEALRAAHADSGRFEELWVTERVWPTGRIVATRAGARRVLDTIDYLTPDRPGLPPRRGFPVRVVARRDSVTAQAGFWFTYGPEWERASARSATVRMYWNIGADQAPTLVRELTGRLRAAGVTYSLKLPTEALGYGRRDAAVVFLRRSDFHIAAPELREAHAVLAPHLGSETPPLTRRLGPGLGLAEEPGGGDSFGSHRCRLMAEALAGELGAGSDRDVLLHAIRRRFAVAGIALARPYLNPPGERDYDW